MTDLVERPKLSRRKFLGTDYIHRAMPYPTPGSLSNDDTYAVVAFILSLNGIIPTDGEVDRTSLPNIKMLFIPDPEFDPRRIGKK
jgi:S-disulfanyl-L-cysteine oxidoreductase SoxD